MPSTSRAARRFTVFAILSALTPVAGGVAPTGNGPGPISAVGGIQ
jgi:hypothetical protein